MTKHNRTEPVDKGTKQTRARLREGTVSRLVRTGKLGLDEQSAAREIEYVYGKLTAEVAGKTARYGEYSDPGEKPDWPWTMRKAYRERYLPWSADLTTLRSLRENGPARDIAIAVCAYGATARSLDKAYQWRKGTAQKMLVYALQEYCYIAGWLRRPMPFHNQVKKSA
jgi:hypothetical protein